MPSSPAREYALLALLALLWGSSYLLIKIAVSDIPPITLIAARVGIATVILLGVLALQGDALPHDTRSWRMLFVQSILNSTGAWLLLAWGQQFIDSGLASVLNSTSPIFVFFITLLFTRHESTSLIRLIGACLGLGGVILIVGIDTLDGLGLQVAGQLAALAGALLYGFAAVYGKRLGHLTPTATAAGTMVCASSILIPLSFMFDAPWSLSPSWQSITATLILGAVCTGLALLIYFRLLRTIGSMGVASQAYLRAGIGVLLGMFILGEQVPPAVAAGLFLTILGVVMINLPKRGVATT